MTSSVARAMRVLTLGLAAALMLAIALPTSTAQATSDAPSTTAPAGLLMTMDGHVVWSRHATQERHVASCIKMLNALVVRDHAKLDDVVTVTKKSEIANGGVRLRAGQKLTVRQLLDIMLIHSANDAAMALAIHVGGSEAHFVKMMNAKAKALGLEHTHAVDPNGLSGREISTAEDLATLGRHIMADPVLRGIVGRRKVAVPRPGGSSATYASSDLLLGHYKGLEGIKTGFTSGAGFCYVGAAKRGGVELLGVVLGTSSEAARFGAMRTLFDWGFANFHVRQVVSKDETHTAEIGGKSVTLHAASSASAVVFARGSRVKRQVTTTGADTTDDGRAATLVVSQDGHELARVALLAPRSAAARTGVAILWGVIALAVVGAAVGAWMLAGRRGSGASRPRLRRPRRQQPRQHG